MSIIYSYPEQTVVNADDMLIGTSAELVGGKRKNITRNFSVQQISDFINNGTGIIQPVANDLQIPMFTAGGTKITGSIMSQNIAAGSRITISGDLFVNNDVNVTEDLTVVGSVGLGTRGIASQSIVLNSTTTLFGSIKDSIGVQGLSNQILVSGAGGAVRWTNYLAGLTYKGSWDAFNNNPTLADGIGANGNFYIVSRDGTTLLDGVSDWKVGDWAVFVNQNTGGIWQKIDNTSALTGSGTTSVLAMWQGATQLGNSPISDNSVQNVLNINSRSVYPNISSLRDLGSASLKWNNIHSVNTYATDLNLIGKIGLSTDYGTAGQILSSGGSGPATWEDRPTGTVTGTGTTEVN